jgi:hypothetical protein
MVTGGRFRPTAVVTAGALDARRGQVPERRRGEMEAGIKCGGESLGLGAFYRVRAA